MTDPDPDWAKNLVVHGGPFGGLPLPPNAIVTTDRDLFDWGLRVGYAPPIVKDPAHLLVIQLGWARESNEMLSGMIWEIVLARRDACRASTWLLINEDPALDPHYALDWRTKKTIANWKQTHVYGEGELPCTLRRAGAAEADQIEAAQLAQIASATELAADYREFVVEDEIAEEGEGFLDFGEDEEDEEDEDLDEDE